MSTITTIEEEAQEEEVETVGPIRGFLHWVVSWALPGLGMFSEAYFIFSVGNLKPLWQAQYPDCWVTHETCSTGLLDSLTYTQVAGIITGQLVLGLTADRIGRKKGSILTSGFLLLFGILLAASDGPSPSAVFTMFTVAQYFFGIGVGGEYPVASSSANERAEADARLTDRRGETVTLVFSCQGWGNLINTLVLCLLVAVFGQGFPTTSASGAYVYDVDSLNVVWRLAFALGCLPLLYIFLYRLLVLTESKVWLRKRASLVREGGQAAKLDGRKLRLLFCCYWHRQLATSGSWVVWNVVFYGNKLFQSSFISIVLGGTPTILQTLEWTALNSAVALAGYYFASFTVDRPWMGRMRMQAMGFLWMFVLFTICFAKFDALLLPQNVGIFQFLYYFSTFWGQWGPNATTFLLPAELFPTEARAMNHGLSAALGKVGALVAGVAFAQVSQRWTFGISGFCGLAGAALTLVFVPDVTSLDLAAGDERWKALLHGREYTGEAVNPRYLSLFERLLGYGRAYKREPGLRAEPHEVVSIHPFAISAITSRPSRDYSAAAAAAAEAQAPPSPVQAHGFLSRVSVGAVGNDEAFHQPPTTLRRALGSRRRLSRRPSSIASTARASTDLDPGSPQTSIELGSRPSWELRPSFELRREQLRGRQEQPSGGSPRSRSQERSSTPRSRSRERGGTSRSRSRERGGTPLSHSREPRLAGQEEGGGAVEQKHKEQR